MHPLVPMYSGLPKKERNHIHQLHHHHQNRNQEKHVDPFLARPTI